MTVNQAAARLGVAASTLRVQIRKGKLRAMKRGRDHWITDAEVERYRAESLGKRGHATRSIDARS